MQLDSKNKKYRMFYMKPSSYAKKETGFLAILLSLIVNTTYSKTPCTVLDSGEHTRCILEIAKNPQKFGIDNINFKYYHYVSYVENETYTYIYYRHNKSDSVKCGQKVDQYNDIEIDEKLLSFFV